MNKWSSLATWLHIWCNCRGRTSIGWSRSRLARNMNCNYVQWRCAIANKSLNNRSSLTIRLFCGEWFRLVLQFEIQLKQRILKVLLQGQRLVPYQRGPAALVSWPNRKMLWGLKARYISHHDSGTNIRMGRAFSPCFIERSDLIWSDILSMAFDHRWYVTGRWPWNQKLTGWNASRNLFSIKG